ncbi:MAG: Sua5/YciO/YrdC/YwlC family protein [Candidatus Izimaplasma sp.]|nr:Sua5/YciO/YrdC/YwlC family protein [Candidatus Izimaplasma bacterium]
MITSLTKYLKQASKDDTIIFESDVSYLVGTSVWSKKGLNKILNVTKSDIDDVVILCKNVKQVKNLIENFSENQTFLSDWPGLLNVIFKKNSKLNTLPNDMITIRIPNHSTTLRLLDEKGPMISLPLKLGKQRPITKYTKTLVFESRVDFLIKGSDCELKEPSFFNTITEEKIQ